MNPLKFGIMLIAATAVCGNAQAAQSTDSGDSKTVQLPDGADRTALLKTTAPECVAATGEIIVCGERSERYRIDPAIMEVSRRQAARNERIPGRDTVVAEKCSPVGANGCRGGDVIPITAIALVALKTAVMVANGEDWRELFRTQPDEFREYEKARDAAKRRNRVSVSVGSGK